MLRTTQFAYTLGTNDFVIGEPGNTDVEPRYLVFQTSTLAGWSNNPHIKCYRDGDRWKLGFSEDGTTALAFLTAGANNTLTGTNTFTNDVTIQKTIITGPSATVNIGNNVLYLHANQSGTSSQAGIIVQENGTQDVAWLRLSAERTGWVFKTPLNANTLTLRHTGATIVLDVPTSGGTIATQDWVSAAVTSGVGNSILDALRTRPRRSNFRFYYEKTLTAGAKQPVMRVPARMKIESVSYFRNNTTTITNGTVNLILQKPAGTQTIIPIAIASSDVPQTWVAVSVPANTTVDANDSVMAVVLAPGTAINDISIDISCVLDF